MPQQDEQAACKDLSDSLDRAGRDGGPWQPWSETLIWLRNTTHADGVWLRLGAPTAVTLTQGTLDEDSLAWLGSWADGLPSASETPIRVQETDGTTLLIMTIPRLGVSAESDMDRGYLALGFCRGQYLPASLQTTLEDIIQVAITTTRQTLELRRAQERLSRLRHLYEVGQAIASTLDLDQVLEQSTSRVAEVLGAEASTLMLIDEARSELVFKIPAGPAERILREQRMPIDKGVAGWTATHGAPIIIPDVAADERFYTQIDGITGYRTRSILAVPLQVKGKTIGVLEVINKSDGTSFSPDDQQWLCTLAPLVAAAIENARLYAALQEERDRIIAAEEKVRHELARDPHDGPAGILAAMILNIDMARRQLAADPEKMAKELNFLDSLAQEANYEVRDLLFSLRPLTLETRGLTAALAQLVERNQRHTPFRLSLDASTLPDEAIDPKVASMLFVIIQEALSNIQKHAKARNVWIRLGPSETGLWTEVADDGVGFNVKEVEANYARRGSFGLLNMRERARLIDGQIAIISPRPGFGNGTLVRVEVPLERGRPSR